MATANPRVIVDGDGHVVEDMPAIMNFMLPPYREKYTLSNPFPPLDHLHSTNLHDLPPRLLSECGSGRVDQIS